MNSISNYDPVSDFVVKPMTWVTMTGKEVIVTVLRDDCNSFGGNHEFCNEETENNRVMTLLHFGLVNNNTLDDCIKFMRGRNDGYNYMMFTTKDKLFLSRNGKFILMGQMMIKDSLEKLTSYMIAKNLRSMEDIKELELPNSLRDMVRSMKKFQLNGQ